MTISRSTLIQALWPGVHAWIMDDYNKHPTEYTQIFDMRSSKMAEEKIAAASGFGLAHRKEEGASTEYEDILAGPTSRFTHVAYSLGFIITREALDDNLYHSMADVGKRNLTFSFRTTKEMVAANVLNRGFNTSYVYGDGKPVLAADHPTPVGSQSNVLGTAADLSEASLEAMLTQIDTATNSKGLPIAIKAEKLVISPAMRFAAERLLKSTLRSGGDFNDVNAFRSLGVLPGGYVVNHYLTDPDAWFVLTDVPNGLIGFNRTPFEFKRDNDFDTDNLKAKGFERYSFGLGDWRAIYGTPGA
ncbi:Mu-like prophage major head subunit gpT family protein [Haematobacter sp. UBA3484]|uniref:phage major capsid protein n=1 Tax=Haematobacter sp. UBA3484 TaxID=1946582 RepID=UPI0025C164BC|nr:Mu-like prophage major head subunit gpT family protein [Haematobacter sp. UBA3484]